MPRKKKPLLKLREDMKNLGTYKVEFEPIMEIYVQLREQYDILTATYRASGYAYDETTQNGTKKAPIVTTLEALRKDILAYAAQLGLTARGLKQIRDDGLDEEHGSELEKALRDLGNI